MTTPTIDDYLLTLYILHREETPAISARVAERMRVSAPTVSVTLGRMVKEGLVILQDRKVIEFTDAGWQRAQMLMRRHALAERLLTDILGLPWNTVHAEAHRIEHVISDEVEERLVQKLGYPVTCPHGNPIPGLAPPGIPSPESSPLDRIARPGTVVVERIAERAEDDQAVLDYVQDKGLLPGAIISVQEIGPFNGPITALVDGQLVALGRDIAHYIWVRAVEEADREGSSTERTS